MKKWIAIIHPPLRWPSPRFVFLPPASFALPPASFALPLFPKADFFNK